MATGKVAAILRKRGIPEEEILAKSDGEAWAIVNEGKPRKKKSQAEEICFTGFSEVREDELRRLAIEAGLAVKGTVTAKLAYLCVSDHPGPSKLEKAKSRGAKIVTEGEFLDLLAT